MILKYNLHEDRNIVCSECGVVISETMYLIYNDVAEVFEVFCEDCFQDILGDVEDEETTSS